MADRAISDAPQRRPARIVSEFIASSRMLKRWSGSPLLWILCAAAILRLTTFAWGLPGADGWDDDGIAPRNFLVGVIQTYTPGSYFTYPPLHMLLLTILTAPGWIIALFNAASLSPRDIIAEITQVSYMTYFAVTARLVSIVMSVATIFLVARMTEAVAGRRAGLFAATICTLNAALTYYGQVTNLDGPYLFWSALSVWNWIRIISQRDMRYMRWSALAAAAAIATKDQAYAIFLLSVPLAFVTWFIFDKWPRENARAVMFNFASWLAAATAVLLAIDGAFINPTGFWRRLEFLAGPASLGYAQYQADVWGRLQLSQDMFGHFSTYYPVVVAWFALFGVAVHVLRWRDDDRSRWVAGLVPLFVVFSFTLAFNFVALRSEPRFFLPQSIFIAPYIGVAADEILGLRRLWLRYSSVVVYAVASSLALYQCLGIVHAMGADPRYDAERWMQTHVRPGDIVETYGLNAYLPRFPQDAYVSRVGQKPLKARNPLPNVAEVVQPFGGVYTRRPRFIVVSGFWVRDYLAAPKSGSERAVQEVRQAAAADTQARQYFRALFGQKLPYRMVHASRYFPGIWPVPTEYESLAQTVFLFERLPGAAAPIRVPTAPATYRPSG